MARFQNHTVAIGIVLSTLAPLNVGAQNNGEWRDSLKVASDRLSFYPDSIDLRLRKAAYNLRLSQWQYALEEYDYILARDKYNPSALFHRAYVNEKLARYNFARIDYERLLSVVPGHFEGQLGLALLNQRDKRFTDALDQANRLVSQYPDSAVAYAARAGIEMEQGMAGLAVFDYEEALRRDADNTEYALDYIEALIENRDFIAARKKIEALRSKGVPQVSLRPLLEKLKK